MKRLGAAAVAALILTFPGQSMAATLQPLDADGLNLRAGPAVTEQILGALAAGESATVVGQDGDWIRVRTASGMEAWVSEAYSRISYMDEEALAVVNTDVLNVRSTPSLEGEPVTQAEQGERVRLLAVQPDWWQIRLADGTEGWVAAEYVARDSAGPEVPAAPQAPAEPQEPAEPQAPASPPVAPIEPFDLPPTGQQQQVPPVSQVTYPPYVPVLGAASAEPQLPLGAKEVWVHTGGSVYAGRNPQLYGRVDGVQAGERLTYLGAAEGWLQVVTPRGRKGWLPGSNALVREGKVQYELDEGRWTMGYAEEQAAADPAQQEEELLAVTPPDGLNLRESAALDGRILATLPQGEVLEVLRTQAPWVQVKTSAGLKGWVHGDYTAAVVTGGSATPQAGIGDDLRASLSLSSPGVIRFEVVSGKGTLGLPASQGSQVTVPIATGQAETAMIPVGTAGARSLSFTPAGVAVDLERLPGMRVMEQSPDKLVLELRPVLDGVTVRTDAQRTVYTLQLRGTAAPRAAAQDGAVAVTIPGAIASDLTLPPGVRMEKGTDGITLVIPTDRAHALKETAEGYELHLYSSGLAGKTILLDPGHGGSDPGAVNNTVGVQEKAVNLEVALRVQQLLAARGARVMLTRATDQLPAPEEVLQAAGDADVTTVDLTYRTRLANELGVDCFVSLHHNSGSWSARGTETYFTDYALNGGRGQELAQLMQQYLPPATSLTNRGAKDYDFFVTRNTDAPAVLVELAFVSNPEEGALAKDSAFQQKEAEAIVKALEAFYSLRTR